MIMSKPAKSIAEPKEYLHVELPVSTKTLLRRMNFETRVPITHILVRVIGQAHRKGVLKDWIQGGNVDLPMEAATEQ